MKINPKKMLLFKSLAAGTGFLILVGIFIFNNLSEQETLISTQSLSQNSRSKHAKLQTLNHHATGSVYNSHTHHGPTFKNKGPLSLSITDKTDSKRTATDPSESVLNIILSVNQDLNQPTLIDWQIPEGIEVLDSELIREIAALKAHEPKIMILTVRAQQPPNAPIRVIASGGTEVFGFATTATFDLVNQKSLEGSNEELRQRAATYMKKQGSRSQSDQLKVFQ